MCWNEKAKSKMPVWSFFLFYVQSELRWVPGSQGEKLKGCLDCIGENIVNYVEAGLYEDHLTAGPNCEMFCRWISHRYCSSRFNASFGTNKICILRFHSIKRQKNHAFHPKCRINCLAFQVMLDYWPILNFPILSNILVTAERCEVAQMETWQFFFSLLSGNVWHISHHTPKLSYSTLYIQHYCSLRVVSIRMTQQHRSNLYSYGTISCLSQVVVCFEPSVCIITVTKITTVQLSTKGTLPVPSIL